MIKINIFNHVNFVEKYDLIHVIIANPVSTFILTETVRLWIPRAEFFLHQRNTSIS